MEDENFDITDLPDPYRCTVNILAPKGKEKLLQRIISPLVQWIDPSFQMIKLTDEYLKQFIHPDVTQTGNVAGSLLPTPAISIMLFLLDNGAMCSTDMQSYLKRPPWKIHHKVELQSRRTPGTPVAKQEFYKLSDDLPLWAVCPVHCGNEHLRINLFVRNIRAMVEFYRLITEVEMESNKPGFCIFQLYSQPGLDIQLSLKHCPNLAPYPVQSAFLYFKIKTVETIRTSLHCELMDIGASKFVVRDPDGNTVVLHQTAPVEGNNQSKDKNSIMSDVSEDIKSVRSLSDSHDSGRCSDSDPCFSEAEHYTWKDHIRLHTCKCHSKRNLHHIQKSAAETVKTLSESLNMADDTGYSSFRTATDEEKQHSHSNHKPKKRIIQAIYI